MLPTAVLLVLFLPLVRGGVYSSIPEDLYAFPKYRLAFLNGLPLANHTAQRWLRDGLRGGELEFLDNWYPNPLKGIESRPEAESPFLSDHQSRVQPSPALEHMHLGPSKSYLCLIPPAPTLPSPSSDESQAPVTPSHSWSLLQPLAGSCLYHRQAWFTYSYCHNLHVRQFRELPTTYPHPPGARVVEEDPEWESYTLGKSPTAHTINGELAVNDEQALANNLELARQGAGQRYLVQRWSDGTVCDKTGRSREIEIQFHCSMTMTDTILFVKETRTCEYVLVIHTPRLCGEPGFKSRLEQMPEATIRCREVVDDVAHVDPMLPEAPFPYKRRSHQPIPSPPLRPPVVADGTGKDGTDAAAARDAVDRAHDTAKLLRKALESLLRRGEMEDMTVLEVPEGEEGEFFIAIDTDAQEIVAEDDSDAEQTEEGEPIAKGRGATLEEALRAAGYDIKARKTHQAQDATGDEDSKKQREGRDEL